VSQFDEVDKKSQKIRSKTGSRQASATQDEIVLFPELHEFMGRPILTRYPWVFVNGMGPLIPKGDFEITGGKLVWKMSQKPLLGWAVVFAFPQDGTLFVFQEGKWEKHSPA
jgi:hypothetical protein